MGIRQKLRTWLLNNGQEHGLREIVQPVPKKELTVIDNAQFHHLYKKGETDFRDCRFEGVDFSGVTLRNLDCRGSCFQAVKDLHRHSVNLAGADLSGANFSRMNLSGLDFSRSVLCNAIFVGTNLSRACFYEAQLDGVDFTKADLYWADLAGTQIRNAILNDANFECVDLYGANLDASVTGCNFTGARLPYGISFKKPEVAQKMRIFGEY
ncbi:pentapeptide repeat-containing protein [Alkalinema pantanalense CENA528]|uniref:pentapeptide repeat-containing protein n=1 Tax=Alkalinema pantanalense TaxID=1620705 RepID=UPI003D6FCA63